MVPTFVVSSAWILIAVMVNLNFVLWSVNCTDFYVIVFDLKFGVL